MARYNRECGALRLTLIVFGALTAAAVYTGYRIFPIYYAYYEIENQMQSAIRIASTEDDRVIRQRLMYHINKLDIPIDPEDLVIERFDKQMKITMPYVEVFDIDFYGKTYDLYTFRFNPHAEGAF